MKLAYAAATVAMALAAPLSAAEAATVTRYFNGVFSFDFQDSAAVLLAGKNFRGSFSYETAEVVPANNTGFESVAIGALKQFTLETEFFEARWDLALDIDLGTSEPGIISYFGGLTPRELTYTATGISKPTVGWFNFFAGSGSPAQGIPYDGVRLPENPDFSTMTQQQVDFYLRTEDNNLHAFAFGSFEISVDQKPLLPSPGPGPGPGGPGPGPGPGPVDPVPEPATWAMMIAGFGMIGGALRRRARVSVTFA